MYRYHIKTGFKEADILPLQVITSTLNALDWQYSSHCLDNLKTRVIDTKALLLFIKDVKLDFSNVFEYYSEKEAITKVCYRINWINSLDIILILTPDKKIITIYLNSAEDKHFTLKEYLYTKI